MAAKACGIKVLEFALGMGPKLFSFGRGETKFSLRLLPIGGFCAMEGEESESKDVHAYSNSPKWKRAIVLVAGAFMNILLGFLITLILAGTQPVLASATVDQFHNDGSTVTSNKFLKPGDKIVSINGSSIHIGWDIQLALVVAGKGPTDVKVLRDGKVVELPKVQFPLVSDGQGGTLQAMDFYVKPVQKTIGGVLYHSFFWTIAMVKYVWVSLVKLVTGAFSIKTMSGPVGVTVAMGQAAQQSASSLLDLVAMIAINLGVVNLLPLPALDGGKLLFVVIEALRGKPVKPEYEGWVHLVGFALLMLLLVVVTYNDIARLVT